jgi:hypothetical protein
LIFLFLPLTTILTHILSFAFIVFISRGADNTWDWSPYKDVLTFRIYLRVLAVQFAVTTFSVGYRLARPRQRKIVILLGLFFVVLLGAEWGYARYLEQLHIVVEHFDY